MYTLLVRREEGTITVRDSFEPKAIARVRDHPK